MARALATVSVAFALLISFSSAATAAPTKITTVAGGGSTAMLSMTSGVFFPEPTTPPFATDLSLTSPAAVTWAGPMYWYDTGDPLPFFVLRNNCTIAATTGNNPIGGTSGPVDSGRMWQVMGGASDCTTWDGGYSSTDGFTARFKHPLSLAVWGFDNSGEIPDFVTLIANTDQGRVERGNFDVLDDDDANRHTMVVTSVAGSTPATPCDDFIDPPPAPPDNVAPAAAQFCRVAAVATPLDSVPGGPYVIAEVDRDGVTAPAHGDIYRVESNLVHHVFSGLEPNNVAYTRDGKVLVVHTATRSIEKLDPATGSHDYVAGDLSMQTINDQPPYYFNGDGGEAQSAGFDSPTAVAATYDGGYVIATAGDCRIRHVTDTTRTGTISTIAGSGCDSAPLGDDGPATAAYLNHPTGVAMSPGGILIADTGNDRVRLIDRTSIISAPTGIVTQADFDFASLDTPAHFKCSIDAAASFDCASPFTVPASVTDGTHTLAVWEHGDPLATPSDPADPTPATAPFTLDRTPPAAFALREPVAGASDLSPSPAFSWDATADATSSVDHYELWLDHGKDHNVACATQTCQATPTSPLSEATHTWEIRAVDALGNVRTGEERSFTVGVPPTASFIAAPNPALVGRPVTFDSSASSDINGIARHEWDLDGDGVFETDSGAAASTSRTYDVAATVPISLRVTDGAGKTASATLSLKITSPQAGQNLLGISINSGAQYTNTPNVKLLVKAPATASSILVSNDGGFLAPSTFPVAQSVEWKLDSSGPERLPKTVYSRFMLGPIISETYTDDIILDEVPPVVQQAALAPASKAASAAKAKTYVVKVKAKDSNSGVGKVQVTANKKKPGKLLAYKSKVRVKAAGKPKFVRAQDRAGNFSGWKKLR